MVVQWVCLVTVILYKVPVVSGLSQESPDLGVSHWLWELSDCSQVLFTGLDTTLITVWVC